MEKQWFIQFDQQHKGPFTSDEVMKLWREKELDGESFFWKKGMAHWERMDQLDTFKDFFPPNSIPVSKVEKLFDRDVRYTRPLPDLPLDHEIPVSNLENKSDSQADSTQEKRPALKASENKSFVKSSLKLMYTTVLVLVVAVIGWIYSESLPLKKPDGLSEKNFQVLKQVTSINPDNHIRFESYFNSEKKQLWFSSNIKNSSILDVQFRSLPGKVLSLGGISFSSKGELKDHFSLVDTFEFQNGTQIYPGLYKVTIVYEFDKMKKSYSDVIYLGPGTEDEFSRNLATYQKYVKKIFNSYQEELLQKYETLISLTRSLETRFNNEMKFMKKGREIVNFQVFYVRQIGPFLTKFTIDSYERPMEIKLDVSAIRTFFSKLFSQSKELSGLSAAVIEEIQPIKNMSKDKKANLKNKYQAKFRRLKEQLFYEQSRIKVLKPF